MAREALARCHVRDGHGTVLVSHNQADAIGKILVARQVSEDLALFEDLSDRFVCRLLRRYSQVPFAVQEADLRRRLQALPVARVSIERRAATSLRCHRVTAVARKRSNPIDRSGIGMNSQPGWRRVVQTRRVAAMDGGNNLAENLGRDYSQVVGEAFSNEAKERLATDLEILFQRKDIALPRDRELVAQCHSIKRRVLPSGKVAFEAERTARSGHADRFWAIALACQKERGRGTSVVTEVGARVIG